MSTRGRKPLIIPSKEFRAQVPEPLYAKIELLLYDPTRGKPMYGSRSQLVVALLEKWVAEQTAGVDTGEIKGQNNSLPENPTSEAIYVNE